MTTTPSSPSPIPSPSAAASPWAPSDVDVLVAGAGPAGLALAIDLRRRGVSHRIVSAAAGGFDGSRAKGVQPRTLEVLADLGVLPGLAAHSRAYPRLGVHVGPVHLPRTMMDVHPVTDAVPYPNPWMVAQYDTDAALRARLAELGGAVDFGHRLTTYTDTCDGVVATLERADGTTEQVRSRYLVGADGGASAVRTTAGIDFPGTTDDDDRMIVGDLTLDGLSADRWHVWPRLAGRFMGLCPLPDGRFQLMLKLRPDEDPTLDRAAIASRIRAFTGPWNRIDVHEVHWASVWRPNIRLAEHYRLGHVLLVGDAAHVHPPTGGQGMNTGIQDSYNLGWKLAVVLAGGPGTLLDTYERERQPVAARVLGLSSEIYAAMSGGQALAASHRGDEERQLDLSYAGGPLAPLAASAPSTAEGGVLTGDRAPDAPYVDADGRRSRLHDAFAGPHFTLLQLGRAITPTPAWVLPGSELRTVVVPDPTASLLAAYGVADLPTQVLVRPDGYVAALGDSAVQAFLSTEPLRSDRVPRS